MAKKVVLVKIAELKEEFYVRKSIDEDHAIYLGGLIEDGVKLPPILITPDFRVIDGRHRIMAHDLTGHDSIQAEIVDISDPTELISRAFRANLGGAKPPSKEDTDHTIKLLLEKGVSKKKIQESLELPSSLGKRWVDNVQSKITRQKNQAAADAVTNGGLNIPQAADKYKVDPDKLKDILSGRKKKKIGGVSEIKQELTSRFKSFSGLNAGTLKRLLKLVEDGDMSPKQAEEIIADLERLQSQATKRLVGWKKRFQAAYPVKK